MLSYVAPVSMHCGGLNWCFGRRLLERVWIIFKTRIVECLGIQAEAWTANPLREPLWSAVVDITERREYPVLLHVYQSYEAGTVHSLNFKSRCSQMF